MSKGIYLLFKLILSLANKDTVSALNVTKAYIESGVDIIDCSVEVYPELKKYIDSLDILNKPKLCVSVALSNDIHSKKAKINKNCKKCGKCKEICSQNAINDFRVDFKTCVGCSHCKKVCKFDAIDIYRLNSFKSDIEKIKTENFKPDMLELHLSVKKKKEILEEFEFAMKNYSGNVSVCLSRKYLGTSKIIKLISKLKEMFEKYNPNHEFMVQLDGSSINNANDEYSSNLEALAFYNELKEIDCKFILSGGLNSKTIELLKLFNLKPYGLAFGSYARKIALEPIKLNNLVKDIKEFYQC